ncbi:sensor histidine kinase [Lacrimispora saccharolytica]|uniref:histidine kinase n=1 Tax=Lacrimispora saccharolytica (strain ATCC 35040 / DSM 2544 / NRCC 2533 / WM1) TaxID=610130 RepID=D9R852_LACSW|nr:integral membrane sensor signal transduction histidine kinase [[Clostridium] saccharolyticum WM1]
MNYNFQDASGYRKFRQKILWQLIIMAVISFTVIVVIYMMVWKGKVGNLLVKFFQRFLHMTQEEAFTTYHYVFRYNFGLFFLGAALFVYFLLLFIFLHRFTRYFDIINHGIDALVSEQDDFIQLVPEMAAIEEKLNTVRKTLSDRAYRAQEAEQRKSDLIMYLAHDIRTPLTSVIGYLSLLDEAPDMPLEQKAKYVHITLEKAYRLENLVNEFFEITRYNSQQIKLEKQIVDLYYMLVQIADEFYPVLTPKANTIAVHADENLTAYGDPTQLARVFNNILKNAVAYSDPHTEISISAGERNHQVVITFRNQGTTIPEEELSSIFEKFYRLDKARASNTGGAGLGLAIAKEIITMHQGTIMADSKGGITSLTVTLPVTN